MGGRNVTRIGAIVLHYRFWPEVSHTIAALSAQDHSIARLLVVDNCSADGSAAALGLEPGVELVVAESNEGYAAGMNLGAEALADDRLDAVLCLTHEAVLGPGALTTLVEQLEADPGLGAVGPLLAWREDPARVYSAGVSFDPHTWSTHHIGANEPVAAWTGRGPQAVDSLDGAALLVRRAALDATGPMDESFFLYFEEADWLARMRRLGWRLVCVPGALAVQQPGMPPTALWVRNSLRFLANNAPGRVLARELVRTVYLAVGDLAHGRRDRARARITGLVAFVSRRPARSLVGRT